MLCKTLIDPFTLSFIERLTVYDLLSLNPDYRAGKIPLEKLILSEDGTTILGLKKDNNIDQIDEFLLLEALLKEHGGSIELGMNVQSFSPPQDLRKLELLLGALKKVKGVNFIEKKILQKLLCRMPTSHHKSRRKLPIYAY